MAGKGGAWKVAYADFVTAMMAFFLVMWLISQDQKIKDSIARYFVDPVGFRLSGSSTPNSAGGVFESNVHGPVPGSKVQNAGLGVGNSGDLVPQDNETAVVGEWLLESQGRSQEWIEVARSELRTARQLYGSGENGQEPAEIEEFARRQIAIRLHQKFVEEATVNLTEIQGDLMVRALARVDWGSLADEFLWQARDGSMTYPAPRNYGTRATQRRPSQSAPTGDPGRKP